MSEYSEKRTHLRYAYETSRVVFKKDASADYCYATLINYSPGGMYIETNEYMDIGQAVIIKMEDFNQDAKGPEKYDFYYGQIKWIKNFHTTIYNANHGYGIQFDKPAIF